MSDLSRLPERSIFGLEFHELEYLYDFYGVDLLLQRGRQAGHPSTVTLEGSTHHQLLRHAGQG